MHALTEAFYAVNSIGNRPHCARDAACLPVVTHNPRLLEALKFFLVDKLKMRGQDDELMHSTIKSIALEYTLDWSLVDPHKFASAELITVSVTVIEDDDSA